MNHKIRFLTIAILLIAAAVILFQQPPRPLVTDAPPIAAERTFTPRLSENAKEHILHGDGNSGGHLHGTGTPCESEFPAAWTEDKITTTIVDLADNPVKWRQEDNGYYVSEQNVDDLNVRVVVNESGTEIITAYPTNVESNPCTTP